jgi:NAD+ kinase
VHVAILAKSSERTPKAEVERAVDAVRRVQDFLEERGHTVVVDERTAEVGGFSPSAPLDALPEGADLAVVLGGDGTLLYAARQFAHLDLPIYGINLGRLGFLTDTDPDNGIAGLARVLDGDYTVEQRIMLSGELHRPDGTVLGPYTALNDFVINKGALAQVVRLATQVDDRFVSSYLADGIIISTPTGSTAYGLAVGGPIIVPTTEVMLVAPICPHILTNRPLVVAAGSQIDVVLEEARDDCYLTIDGQEGVRLQPGDTLKVRRSSKSARLVRTDSADFFAILRTKLRWGG